MIVVDTSAILAIAQYEIEWVRCRETMESHELLMSAGTLTELLIVAQGRRIYPNVLELLDSLDIRILDVTPEVAYRIGEAYRRWGKGFHPAGLNYGDCFAYEAAKNHNCPLLYVGQDFSKTDVLSALAA